MELIIVVIALIVAYTTGTMIEKAHYKDIIEREKKLLNLPIVSFQREDVLNKERKVKEVKLVSACVVVSADYFKLMASSLKSFFGGRLTVLESVIDRSRREAVLRLREQSPDSHIILNLRLQDIAMNVPNSKNQGGNLKSAVIAYGTAITYE
ncbi:uncharacterized protein YbjQ (UPF0145 family) [Elusimicrobium posterum]|uniref:YbjQ family protein n=1 Tax=Elusimicrobium posterum TaxID=3116653 RepID=UPI003C73D081